MVRHRRVALVAALLAGLGLALGDAHAVAFALVACLIVFSVLALKYRRPTRLEVEDRAFATLVWPQPVALAVALTVLGGNSVYNYLAAAIDGDLDGLDVTLAVLYIAVLAMLWFVVWTPPRLRLTPDGIVQRRPLGSRVVPWEALDPVAPLFAEDRARVVLNVERGDLVAARGLPGRAYSLESGTDPAFLCRVITEYVTEPGSRAAIGTEAELNRLNRL
ncbi:hypothetical protein Ade02nite_32340 [Paractinoplanes deccanensis]|uniref:PH domain-containing protein n=2 Tax=Paractinoplanes deccanensis TaxID=113561 RepID=A0ABQ3Y3M4_9ACTN|nr:hypothetical protein Ade02nite_32340 [Actinoplanes deccanensis]